MNKVKLIGKIFGIALVLMLIGAMLGGLPALVSQAEASPATIYVPDNYATIQAVVDAASPGDTSPPEVEWSKTFGGLGSDGGQSVQQTSDGGYIVTGWTGSYGAGSSDVWLIKTNTNGDIEWDKTFGGLDDDGGRSVQQTSDGGYIILALTLSYGAGELDVWLIKTDSEGNEEWSKTFGGPDNEQGMSVQQTSDGGYIIVGGTECYGTGKVDVWLIKTNSEGNDEWNKTFGGPGNDWGISVQQTSDGGYIVTGWTDSYGAGSSDVWLIKTNANGDIEWDKTFGGLNGDGGRSVQQTSDGGYIIVGRTVSYSADEYSDVWLIKTDSGGNIEWSKTFSSSSFAVDNAEAVQQTSDGGYIIAGWTRGWAVPDTAWLIKTTSQGNGVWVVLGRPFYFFLGGAGDDYFDSVQQTWDGGYVVVGTTTSNGAGSADVWLVKLKSEDTTPPTVSSVSPEDNDTDVPTDTVVTATFSEAMDETTIDETSFTLAGSFVSGTVTYDSDTYTATFNPDANLDYNHEYTATLNTAITDEAGNPLTGPYTWSFTTGPLAGKIAFASERDGNAEIYVMDVDGSNQTRITNSYVDDYSPSWSPDGRQIAFESQFSNNKEIYVMDADGSNLIRLTNNYPANDREPDWSPDGRQIAFYSDRDGNWKIYVMDADGSNQTRLTNNSLGDYEPDWSPDGGQIVFRSNRDIDPEIYVMDADGSNQTRLTNNPGADTAPAWSPDGNKIAFISYRDGNWEIYVMNADGSNQTKLTNNSALDWRPAWSPDGRQIAFTSDRDGNAEIYVMNADGSNQTNLTNNSASDSTPAWSSDGTGTPPTVVNTFPEDGATDVRVDTVVTATFSEAMDEATIDETSFTLAGSAVSGTVEYNPDTYTATFTPGANLDYNHEYTATLGTAMTDLAGNPLAEAYSWSFTTESAPADTTPPPAVTNLRTVEITSSGFIYPIGRSEPYTYAGWLAGGPGMPPYQESYYHLGQDMETNEGDDVYAIADGEIIYVSVGGWGEGNYGLLVKHRLDTGEEFLALYGHVRPNREDLRYAASGPVAPSVPVTVGEAFATIGPYDSIPHLHFGIHPGSEVPASPWGRMPLDQWPDTNDFVNPINWLTTRTPFNPLDPTSSIMLAWTAPGDDGEVGTASEYDIRYSTSEITEANWDSATQYEGEPAPQSAGSSESLTVTELPSNTAYYFALKTADEVPNWSGLSNVVSGTTRPEVSISVTLSGSFLPVYEVELWPVPPDQIVTAKIADSASLPIEVEVSREGLPVTGARVFIQECLFPLGVTDENGVIRARYPITHPPKAEDFKAHIGAEVDSSIYSSGLVTLYSSRLLGTMSVVVTEDEAQWYPAFLLLHYFLQPGVPAPKWLLGIKMLDQFAKIAADLKDYSPEAGDILHFEAFEYTASGVETAYAVHLTIKRGGVQIYERTQWTDKYELVEPIVLVKLAREALTASLASPANLWVTDPDGRCAGINPDTGELVFEFPMAITALGEEHQQIVIPEPLDGEYEFGVIGTQEGSYNLVCSNIDETGNVSDTFTGTDIPTAAGAVHQYSIDWEALSQGEKGVTIKIDSDGDGEFEDTFTADEELTQDEFMLQTATSIDFDPDTLNLGSEGKFVTVYIELPTGYDVSQIDVSSILLNGEVPALDKPTKVGDYDSDGVHDLMVKFDGAAVQDLLTPGSQVEITVTGEVTRIGFEGTDTIRVIDG